MPKVDIDYSNTIIYKITCKNTLCKEVYVGHTTNFVQRKHAHKQSCKNHKSAIYNCKLYEAIRNHGGWDNWNMEIINFYNCKDHSEAIKKENEYINLLNTTLNSIQQLSKPKEPVIKIKKKDYHCEVCNIKVANQQLLEVNNQTKKHNKTIMKQSETKKEPKRAERAEKNMCEFCDLIYSKNSNYNRHMLTSKHKNRVVMKQNETNETKKEPKRAEMFICECGKQCNSRTTFWRHKKKCSLQNIAEEKMDIILAEKKDDGSELKIMFMELLKQNKEMQKSIIQLANKPSTINNTNNTNNTNNNQFNINVFLNEKCKDAMNITDFVTSLKLTLQDLEKTGELGYVKGITNIILNGLNELDVYKRPIHCSDLKRETLYVKDKDVWEKENEGKKKIKNAIKHISSKNSRQVGDWQKENKGYDDYSSKKHDKYMKIIRESNGGEDDEIKKIIKNIAPNVVIDKTK